MITKGDIALDVEIKKPVTANFTFMTDELDGVGDYVLYDKPEYSSKYEDEWTILEGKAAWKKWLQFEKSTMNLIKNNIVRHAKKHLLQLRGVIKKKGKKYKAKKYKLVV